MVETYLLCKAGWNRPRGQLAVSQKATCESDKEWWELVGELVAGNWAAELMKRGLLSGVAFSKCANTSRQPPSNYRSRSAAKEALSAPSKYISGRLRTCSRYPDYSF
jgi:hypothetical protein